MTAAVILFRNFANDIRQPAPYRLGMSELKGIANVVIGSLQLAISVYMRYSKNTHYNSLTQRHVEIGKEALGRSIEQLAPAILTATICYVIHALISPCACNLNGTMITVNP